MLCTATKTGGIPRDVVAMLGVTRMWVTDYAKRDSIYRESTAECTFKQSSSTK